MCVCVCVCNSSLQTAAAMQMVPVSSLQNPASQMVMVYPGNQPSTCHHHHKCKKHKKKKKDDSDSDSESDSETEYYYVQKPGQRSDSTCKLEAGFRLIFVSIRNESVPKIIINDTINLFFNCNQHFGNFKP